MSKFAELYGSYKMKKTGKTWLLIGINIKLPEIKKIGVILVTPITDREMVCISTDKFVEMFEKIE